ncbi:hypothetical protein FRB94_006466 [Tulasnella sp. JGI-2019a]|nr:hypothetical protein FRB93_004105 [Tulasnella sp. JGI-2019a]KAG8999046.1 hypothetical protein FRB94_006466 [Tulasnella sp. JGI-2019a]
MTTDGEQLAAAIRRADLIKAGLPPWVHLLNESIGTWATINSEATRHRSQYSAYGQDKTFDDSDIQPPSQSLRQ